MKRLVLWMALTFATLGCDVSPKCDANQVYRNHDCYNTPDSAGTGGGGGTDNDAASSEDTGTESGMPGSCTPYEGFGATCAVDSDCPCGLDSCNTFQGNYCTHSHCLAAPSICPPGWTCMDIRAFNPAVESVCARP